MKVDCKVFKGIEYVQVSELPDDQRGILIQTINPDLYIKILIDGKIVSGCLQYKDYAGWYNDHFAKCLAPSSSTAVREVGIQPNIAFKA